LDFLEELGMGNLIDKMFCVLLWLICLKKENHIRVQNLIERILNERINKKRLSLWGEVDENDLFMKVFSYTDLLKRRLTLERTHARVVFNKVVFNVLRKQFPSLKVKS